MKKIFFLLIIVAALFTACQPDELIPYTSPAGSVTAARLQGTWKVTRVTITDQVATDRNFPYKTIDATADFGLDKMTLQLNAAGSFTVSYNGAAPVFAPAAGNWKTNNSDKPGEITFMGTSDTLRTMLGPYTTFQTNKMILKQNRVLEGKVVTVYQYEFQKQ